MDLKVHEAKGDSIATTCHQYNGVTARVASLFLAISILGTYQSWEKPPRLACTLCALQIVSTPSVPSYYLDPRRLQHWKLKELGVLRPWQQAENSIAIPENV